MTAILRAGLAALAVLAAALPARAEIDIELVTSPGGITAWLYEDHTIPILSIEANIRGGAALDPEGKEGATSLMASLLEEGAGGRDATAFAEAVEALGARFGFRAGSDGVSVSAQMLTENREDSLALLRDALTAPAFEPTAFARVRGQLLSILRREETDPDAIVARAFNETLFAGGPYARPADGTLESVAALTPEDMRAAHTAALVRDRLRIAVVGDITADALGPVLDTLFGDLPETGPDLPPVTEAQAGGTLDVIDFPIPQSLVLFGHGGIARDDPDFIPAYVLNHILGGGGFGSRLTRELREKRGLTYGIYTYLAPGEFGWSYRGRFSTANANAGEAIELVRAEWERIARDGVTGSELDAARKYLTGAYALRFSGTSGIARQLLGLQIAGLGTDYVHERNALIEAVTRDDIARVAARILHPEQLTFTVIGAPESLTPTN